MNKVLVTGLALGYEVDACQVCNFDLSWLFRYPSTLVWADKILVTPAIRDTVRKGYSRDNEPLSRSLRLVFDFCEAQGIIEIGEPGTVISPSLRDSIFEQVQNDRGRLADMFPDHVSLGDEDQVPGQLFVDGIEYCLPSLWSIYAALLLSKAWDAHSLFSTQVLNYCRFKFGLAAFPDKADPGRVDSFSSVFDAYLPNLHLFPHYAYAAKDLCAKCGKESDCSGNYLSELEVNLRTLVSWRDYDEIHQLRGVVQSIVEEQVASQGVLDPREVRRELRDREAKLRRRMRLVFPQVKRWANMTTMLSIPVAVAGAAADMPLIIASAAAAAGLATLATETVELLSSKSRWVTFASKEADLHLEH